MRVQRALLGLRHDAATVENGLLVSYEVQHTPYNITNLTLVFTQGKWKSVSTANINYIFKNKPPGNNANVPPLGGGQAGGQVGAVQPCPAAEVDEPAALRTHSAPCAPQAAY